MLHCTIPRGLIIAVIIRVLVFSPPIEISEIDIKGALNLSPDPGACISGLHLRSFGKICSELINYCTQLEAVHTPVTGACKYMFHAHDLRSIDLI